MAGFFGLFDYNKEGPGVYLNEPPKGPVKTFFAILGRKFWKIVTLNIMYVLFSIPVIIIALLVGAYVFPMLLPFLQIEILEKLLTGEGVGAAITAATAQTSSKAVSEVVQMTPKETAAFLFVQFNLVLSMSLIGMQLFVVGPVQAGVTYILRNYSREEHAFMWGDFKDHARKNFKQSIITGTIGILAFIIMSVNFSFYASGDVVKNGILNSILTGLMFILFLMFAMMQMYIYPMMVTFKLSIRQLYKNSLLLTIAKLPSNIGIFLLSTLIVTLIPILAIFFLGGIGIVFCIFYYLFIGFGLNLYLTNFYVYRQLKKYMIDPTLEEERKARELLEQQEDENSEKSEEEPIFRDSIDS